MSDCPHDQGYLNHLDEIECLYCGLPIELDCDEETD